MDLRNIWKDKNAQSQVIWQTILSRAEEGERIEPQETWLATVPFQRPNGSTGYLAGSGDVILGVLPFYDFLFAPIPFHIKDQAGLEQCYGIDSHFFLDLVETGRVIPVFPAPSDLYTDFVVKEIWGYLEARGLNYLLASQINALSVGFQSISGVMLPWDDQSRDPWWTEMMIKASALNGRLIANFPSDPARFASSKADFDRLPPEIKSDLGLIEAEKLNLVARALRISISDQIGFAKYDEILDGKTATALRRLFESAAALEEAGGGKIVELCKQYNSQIEEIAESKGYKLAKLTSDLFTKHVLTISLGVLAGAVGGPLPGLAGLVVGEVAQKIATSAETQLGELLGVRRRSLTALVAGWLGKDSSLVHLCSAREMLKES